MFYTAGLVSRIRILGIVQDPTVKLQVIGITLVLATNVTSSASQGRSTSDRIPAYTSFRQWTIARLQRAVDAAGVILCKPEASNRTVQAL